MLVFHTFNKNSDRQQDHDLIVYYLRMRFWNQRIRISLKPSFDQNWRKKNNDWDTLKNSLLKLSNAQLNIGAVGKDKKVDQWHFDSINFVAVLIFSNIDNMIGKDSI